MIGPGSFVVFAPRPSRPGRGRVLAYVRARKPRRGRGKPRAVAGRADATIVFDLDPVALPVATLRTRAPGRWAHQGLGGLARWFVARWAWLRPRTVPVLAGVLGAWLVLATGDYLRRAPHAAAAAAAAHRAPKLDAVRLHVDPAPAPARARLD